MSDMATDLELESAVPSQTPASSQQENKDSTPAPQLRAKGTDDSLVPDLSKDSEAALDDLISKRTANEEEKPAAPAADEKPADEKPADKPVDEKPADEKPADDKKKDRLDEVELPPYTKPKAAESFARVKEIARQELKQREEQIAALQKERDEAVKKSTETPKVSPEELKELEDLRNWRKSIDVENDPSWKEFDGRVSKNVENIYSKLKEAGMSEANISEIKKLGGPAQVDWEPIYEKLPSATRRYIDAKLVENENISEQKKEALASAKTKADEFLKARTEKEQKSEAQTIEAQKKAVDAYRPKLEWLNNKDVPANATPEQKKEIETHNAFVGKMNGIIEESFKNRSPEYLAQLAVGTVLAHYYSAANAGLTDENKRIADELAKANAELDRIKKASGANRREAATPVPPKKTDIFGSAEDALDNLKNQLVGR